MKKLYALTITVTLLLSLVLTSCGSSIPKGDAVSYYNGDKSFSIDLPTSNEDDWSINEETTGDVLDISDKNDTLNIQVECLSKSQAQYIASNLEAYEAYAITNTLNDIYSNMELKDAKITTPNFIKNSISKSFTIKDGSNTLKGALLFMESDKCYYTYLITALDDTYNSNKKAILKTVESLKEITES